MEVFDCKNDGPVLTGFENHLPKRLERSGLDHFRRERPQRARFFIRRELMKKIRRAILRIHAYFIQASPYLCRNGLGGFGVADIAEITQDLEEGKTGNTCGIGEAAAFEKGDSPGQNMLA